MKNQKGVSLFEVIIAIIILLIIAFFAIFNSKDSVNQAKATEVYSEMRSVETAVEFVKSQMVMHDDFKLEKGKHYDEPTSVEEITDNFDRDVTIYGMLEHEDGEAAMYLGLERIKERLYC